MLKNLLASLKARAAISNDLLEDLTAIFGIVGALSLVTAFVAGALGGAPTFHFIMLALTLTLVFEGAALMCEFILSRRGH